MGELIHIRDYLERKRDEEVEVKLARLRALNYSPDFNPFENEVESGEDTNTL